MMKQDGNCEDSSESYRHLIDSVDGIVWEANPDFTFTFVSKQAERILGYPVERWLREPGFWASILHPDDKERALAFCREQTKLLLPHTFEYRAIAADGSDVWLRDLVSVHSEKGQPRSLSGIMVDVTSRHVAEDHLKQSEERFRMMVEKSQEGIWLLDNRDVTTFANPKLCEILGYQPQEMIGRSVFDFMDQCKVEEAANSMRRRRMGICERMDFIFRRKDGRRAWVSLAANPFFDSADRYSGAMAMVSDVSDNRRREKLLAAQRNVFEQLLDGKTLSQSLDSLVHKIEEMGDGMRAAVYFLREDGEHLLAGAAPSIAPEFIRIIEQVKITPEIGTCAAAVFRKAFVVTEDVETDSLWKDVRETARKYSVRACWAQPFFNREGKVLGVFSMYFRDRRRPDEFDLQLARDSAAAVALVTEHVNLRDSLAAAVTRLKESEERFRRLADATYDGVVIHDQGKILAANLSQVQMFGYTVNELENMSVMDLTAPEARAMLKEKLEGASHPPYELQCMRKDGSRFWGEVRSRDAVYEGRSVRVSSVRDVTERRNWEKQKELSIEQERHAREEAEKAIRLRDDFLAIASHELKTPLTPLKLDLQLQRRYLKEVGLPPSRKADLLLQAIDHADREFQRLTQLIDDLLDTSRIAAGRLPLRPKETDLSDTVKQLADRFRPLLEKTNCSLTADIQDGVVAWCDRARIEQVLSNLLLNAQKYGAGYPVELKISAQNGIARISVTDHGIGIDPEFHQYIFERFVRAAPVESYGGLGLGLFIVKEIVEAHGGRVLVESALGEGARFTVELPLGPGDRL